MVAHVFVPRKQTKGTDGEVRISIVEEERLVDLETMIIGRSRFFSQRLTSLFVVYAVKTMRTENGINTKDVAVFGTAVYLIDVAIEIANDDSWLVGEVWGVFVDNFLCYLGVEFVICNIFAFCWPDGEDEDAFGKQGNSIVEVWIVPVGNDCASFFPNDT